MGRVSALRTGGNGVAAKALFYWGQHFSPISAERRHRPTHAPVRAGKERQGFCLSKRQREQAGFTELSRGRAKLKRRAEPLFRNLFFVGDLVLDLLFLLRARASRTAAPTAPTVLALDDTSLAGEHTHACAHTQHISAGGNVSTA